MVSKNEIAPADDSGLMNDIVLVHSGEDYFLRLRGIIASAKRELHLQTYIFADDIVGTGIADALKEAALRGVHVYVLPDGFGSSSLSEQVTDMLKGSGVHFRFFAPFFTANTFYLGRRLHHKVVVADSSIALIGGINIADKYHGSPSTAPWLDYAVQIKGAIAEELQALCRKIYFRKNNRLSRKIKFASHPIGDATVRLLQNDWLKGRNEIGHAYLSAIQRASDSVTIAGSYFLPGRRLTMALKRASRRGVKVKIILSGISDVPLMRRAARHLYASLLSNDIELYEWQKSVLHGKAAVVDAKWTTVGSYNLNHLSTYGSIELNVEIHSRRFSADFSQHLHEVMSQCERVTFDQLKLRRNVFTNLLNRLSYYLVTMALGIVTYMPYKRYLQ